MKKRLTTLLSLALSLTLMGSLILPAAATEPAANGMTGLWTEDGTFHAEIDADTFDADAYFREHHPEYPSKAEYMAQWGQTEEEFRAEMLAEYAFYFGQERLEQGYMAMVKQAAGGYPDGLNLMINGKCVTFSDVRPVIVNDRTMVPLAAAMEHLGAEVEYDAAAHAALVSLDGRSFTHKIGTSTMVTSDGGIVAMDVSSYIDQGRTMVPLSFFANYLGFETYWDGDYYTAVLLDRRAAVDQIDGQFTRVNWMLRAMSNTEQLEAGWTVRTDVNGTMTLTLLDDLNSGQKFDMTVKSATLENKDSAETKLELDLGEALAVLTELTGPVEGEAAAELQCILEAVSPLTMEARMDPAGKLYLHSTELNAAVGLDKDVWICMVQSASGTGEIAPTVGSILTYMAYSGAASPFEGAYALEAAAAQLAAAVGDDAFDRNGAGIQFQDEEAGASGEFEITIHPRSEEYYMALRYEDSELSVMAWMNGSTVHKTEKINELGQHYFSVEDCPNWTKLTVKIYLKDMARLSLNLSSESTYASRRPYTAPPEGAKVIDLEDPTVLEGLLARIGA